VVARTSSRRSSTAGEGDGGIRAGPGAGRPRFFQVNAGEARATCARNESGTSVSVEQDRSRCAAGRAAASGPCAARVAPSLPTWASGREGSKKGPRSLEGKPSNRSAVCGHVRQLAIPLWIQRHGSDEQARGYALRPRIECPPRPIVWPVHVRNAPHHVSAETAPGANRLPQSTARSRPGATSRIILSRSGPPDNRFPVPSRRAAPTPDNRLSKHLELVSLPRPELRRHVAAAAAARQDEVRARGR
jgi:hypothetical protein